MYERYYRLQKAPFHITPDPEFLFLSPTHKEALASIIYGVEGRKGFIVIVGEVGLGKTTVVRQETPANHLHFQSERAILGPPRYHRTGCWTRRPAGG
jgi:general secretion pathway protein A